MGGLPAQQSDLDIDNYKIPLPGKYLAELQFKIWGKYPCLHCFFKTQNGDKIRLASFKDKETGRYSPRDLKINFSEPGIEFNMYLLHVETNSKGRPAWLSAEKVDELHEFPSP